MKGIVRSEHAEPSRSGHRRMVANQGRKLDGIRAPLDAMAEIVDGRRQIEVICDGGTPAAGSAESAVGRRQACREGGSIYALAAAGRRRGARHRAARAEMERA